MKMIDSIGSSKLQAAKHVVGIPMGDLHGHVNPMLCFLTTLPVRNDDIQVTLVVTEDWLRSSSPASSSSGRMKFVKLPENAVPPASGGGGEDFQEFLESVQTEMMKPMELLLDQIQPPPDLLVADGFLPWAVQLGKRRKVAVASFWPASASLFSIFFHSHIVLAAHSFPLDDLRSGEERSDLIPGVPSIRLAYLPGEFQLNDKQILSMVTNAITKAIEAQCIIFRTTNDLEEAALSALKTAISIPIYTIGPAVPYFVKDLDYEKNTNDSYIKWLDSQQKNSVLYVSLGTFLPTLASHIDELAVGVKESGIPFLWVARDGGSCLSHILDGKNGKVVSWCDQMRVLLHPSIGGFVTHCGWNSTVEVAFAGVPTLVFPLGLDQTLNSKIMVEDWGIGWRLKNNFQELVKSEDVLLMLNKFMDLESLERKELDEKCKSFKERILFGVDEDGSTSGLDEFLLCPQVSQGGNGDQMTTII